MIRRSLALLLLLMLLCGAACAEEAFYTRMPEALTAVQTTRSETVGGTLTVKRTCPRTSCAQVDAEIAALVEEMVQAALPAAQASGAELLDVGAVITRSGTSFMSFLTIAETTGGRELLSASYDARVYDMATGERVTMADVLAADGSGYDLLAQAVREQLGAAFPAEAADEAALGALCTREALESAPFTLGAASMTLTYRADAVYPGHGTLLHVTVPYAQLRPEMTARGQAQTDNSRFRMAALTYDDGCAQKNTLYLLDQLRRYGAQATFFILGERIAGNHNVLSRQQNAGYSIQTHTWGHSYTWELSREEKEAERDRFAEALGAVTGVPPTLMRAPGGSEDGYDMGYPLIHWSLATGDSSNDNVEEIVERTKWSVKDGTIVLMHDINANCSRYTREIVESLTDRGFLLVTVQELFLDAGIPLEDGMVYGSTSRMWRVKE